MMRNFHQWIAGLALALIAGGFGSLGLAGRTALGEERRPILGRDMVWTAYEGGRRQIVFSTQGKDGAWSQPVMLSPANDLADNLLPCVVSAPGNRTYAVWVTRGVTARLQIMYTVFDGQEWTEGKLVPNLPNDATMPFVALDDAGVLWLVFSGNDGNTQDDIYTLQFKNNEWTRPEPVNAPNEVPDVNPYIEIGQDGAIQVTWEGFRGNGYVLLTTTLGKNGWSEESMVPQQELETMRQERKKTAEEKLPDFVQDRSMLFMRSNN